MCIIFRKIAKTVNFSLKIGEAADINDKSEVFSGDR